MVLSEQVKESVRVPVVANGDIKCEQDIHRVADVTGVDGEFETRAQRQWNLSNPDEKKVSVLVRCPGCLGQCSVFCVLRCPYWRGSTI